MEQIIQYIQDAGLYTAIMVMVLFLGLKYLPKWIEIKLSRSKEKDYMMDSFKSVIENNSKVMENNSEVIKSNSIIIKNFTDNSHKLEDKVGELTKIVHATNQNVEILKEIEELKK